MRCSHSSLALMTVYRCTDCGAIRSLDDSKNGHNGHKPDPKRKLHGRYLGLTRAATVKTRMKAKGVYKKDGIRAAIGFLEKNRAS